MSDAMTAISDVSEGRSPMSVALDKIAAIVDPPAPVAKAPARQAPKTEAKPVAKAPAAKTSAAPAEAEEEPLDPRLAETEEEAAAAGAESETEAETEVEAKPESETGEIAMPETVEDLAKAIGIEPDDLLNLKDKDGKTLAEKMAGGNAEEVQKLKADVEIQASTLKAEQEQFQAAVNEYSERYTGALKYAAGLIHALEQQLVGSMPDQATLDRMFNEDLPGYLALERQMKLGKERLDNFKSAFQEAVGKERAETDKKKQESDAKRQERVSRGMEALAKAVPELAPGHSKRAETSAAIVQYAVSQGFKPEDVQRVADNGDHRMIAILNDARLYRQGQASKGQVVKKIQALKLPKLTPPTGRAPKADARVESFKKHKTQLRRTGSQRDAEAAIASLIGD